MFFGELSGELVVEVLQISVRHLQAGSHKMVAKYVHAAHVPLLFREKAKAGISTHLKKMVEKYARGCSARA